ncbi:hypothetical protein D3C80_1427300 [compost metagenome]
MVAAAQRLRFPLQHPQHQWDIDPFVHLDVRRRLNPRQRQQLFDQPIHTPGLLLHSAQRFAAQRAIQLFVAHHLQVALQHRERGTQLVADVGEEVASRAFQLAHLGDVTRHHQ